MGNTASARFSQLIAAGDRSDGVRDLRQIVGCRFRLDIWLQDVHHDVAMQPMPRRVRGASPTFGFAQTAVIVHRLTGDRYGETTQQRHVNACRRGRIWHHRRIFPRSDEQREGLLCFPNGGCC
jgi:hypothetical protein